MTFRPDVEGLRGLAILLVVLAHARVPGMDAGFVGVDIFFVISGYLITGLITRELQARGRLDYVEFFARRALRLGPALLTMIVVIAVISWWLLPSGSLVLQLESGTWAALWASNLYFTFAGFDYFGAQAEESLFLHTWSLGVEEQFYLLWPWLVVAAWRRWRSARWLMIATGLGLLLTLAIRSQDATAAYYLMPARLWQLALGGLIYRITADAGPVSAAQSDRLAAAGFGLLVLSLLLIDPSAPLQGLLTCLPSVAAGCLLAAGARTPGRVVNLLAVETLRLPGRISYGWYLWHWPCLAFLPALGAGHPTARQTWFLVLLSFLVAWASHVWIETPLRRRGAATAARVIAITLIASVALAGALWLASLAIARLRGAEAAAAALEHHVTRSITIPSIYYQQGCDQWFHSSELVPCWVEAGDGSAPAMVVVADSVGAQWLPALEHVARQQGRRLLVLTKSSCAIVDEPFFYARINRRFTECEQWRARVVDHVHEVDPGIVILGSTSNYEFTREQWVDGSSRMVRQLSGPGRTVVILAPTPILPLHPVRCVVSRGRLVGTVLDAPDCAVPLQGHEAGSVIASLQQAVSQQDAAYTLYLNDLVCPHGRCDAVLNGRLVFRDEQHLNAAFVESLGPAVEGRLNAVMQPSANR